MSDAIQKTELSLSNFAAWSERNDKLLRAREWLARIGKTGRSTRDATDILHISPAHCRAPQFSIAGQYTTGGQNYWDSPGAFNDAIQTVILDHFTELAAEAMAFLQRQTDDALVKAESEIQAIQSAIMNAKAES